MHVIYGRALQPKNLGSSSRYNYVSTVSIRFFLTFVSRFGWDASPAICVVLDTHETCSTRKRLEF